MAKTTYPSDKQDQFMLRLPDGMRDRIKAAAEANHRSMNAEIVAALEEKYPAPPPGRADLATLNRMREHVLDMLKEPPLESAVWQQNKLQGMLKEIDAQIELARKGWPSLSEREVHD